MGIDHLLTPGRVIAKKYEVVSLIGSGWEGEVYKVREINTRIERAAKLFYPDKNINGKVSKKYAQKLHKLRDCSILIQYHAEETIVLKKKQISLLISEYIEGEILSLFLKKFHRSVLQPFQALHLLHALACGIEEIHNKNEYHGDLHLDNIIIKRFGLGFDLKLVDMYQWGDSKIENKKEDIVDLIKIFYKTLGGEKRYAMQHDVIKNIICGQKRSLILKKFPTIQRLRSHIETMAW